MTIKRLLKKCNELEKRTEDLAGEVAVLKFEILGMVKSDKEFYVRWPELEADMQRIFIEGNKLFGVDPYEQSWYEDGPEVAEALGH